MENIFRVAENEIYRLIKSKKVLITALFIILLCIIASMAYSEMSENVAANLPISQKYPIDLKELLRNLNSVNFARLSATDFIYKPYFSFYAIFMVLSAVDIFVVDKESGTMKFTKLSGVSFGDIYAGKIIAAFCISVAAVMFNFAAAFFCGIIGNPISFDELFSVFIIYFSAAFSGTAIMLSVAILSFLPINTKILLGGGVLGVFILGMADRLGGTKFFSPTGLLSVFGNSVPEIGKEFLICLCVSAAYCVVFSMAVLFVSRHTDYFD
jgi:ABC-type transport system involved in multi-copper enzyme maturation permease subunit